MLVCERVRACVCVQESVSPCAAALSRLGAILRIVHSKRPATVVEVVVVAVVVVVVAAAVVLTVSSTSPFSSISN